MWQIDRQILGQQPQNLVANSQRGRRGRGGWNAQPLEETRIAEQLQLLRDAHSHATAFHDLDLRFQKTVGIARLRGRIIVRRGVTFLVGKHARAAVVDLQRGLGRIGRHHQQGHDNRQRDGAADKHGDQGKVAANRCHDIAEIERGLTPQRPLRTGIVPRRGPGAVWRIREFLRGNARFIVCHDNSLSRTLT